METTILYGSHYFLSVYSIYWYALIYLFSFPTLWLGRIIFEGKGYDIAFSSKFGDAAFTAFIVMIAYIVRQPDFHPLPWMESKLFHLMVGGLSMVSAAIYYFVTKPKRVMDIWHALFVFPMFMFLIVTTIPVLWVSPQFSLGLLLLFVWGVLVVYDIIMGRMDQGKWIKQNLPKWQLKK